MFSNELLATLLNYGSSWNLILLIIGGCSIVSFAIFIERMLYLRRSEVDTNRLIIGLRSAIQEGNLWMPLRSARIPAVRFPTFCARGSLNTAERAQAD